jgi:hypothetical protein
VRVSLAKSGSPATESWKLVYLSELYTLHPSLWSPSRAEELFLLCASTRPPIVDVFSSNNNNNNNNNNTLPCVGSMANNVWPLDDVMCGLCKRITLPLSLRQCCERVGYWRGIVDAWIVDEDDALYKLRICLFAGDANRAIALMESWCGVHVKRWESVLNVVRNVGATSVVSPSQGKEKHLFFVLFFSCFCLLTTTNTKHSIFADSRARQAATRCHSTPMHQ